MSLRVSEWEQNDLSTYWCLSLSRLLIKVNWVSHFFHFGKLRCKITCCWQEPISFRGLAVILLQRLKPKHFTLAKILKLSTDTCVLLKQLNRLSLYQYCVLFYRWDSGIALTWHTIFFYLKTPWRYFFIVMRVVCATIMCFFFFNTNAA